VIVVEVPPDVKCKAGRTNPPAVGRCTREISPSAFVHVPDVSPDDAAILYATRHPVVDAIVY
jgi:hypothetical protein